MTAEDIVVTDVNGTVIEALDNRVPTSELATHTMIYREFSDVNAVVHAHAPFITAVTTVEDGLPSLNYEQLFFINRIVPVIPFVMPGTEEMAEKVCEALKESPAIVIRNHGLFAVGGGLAETVVRAVVAEDAARLYVYARSIGQPKLLPEDIKKPA
jgi:L-ribulose-5-phosphate 4-epimerase